MEGDINTSELLRRAKEAGNIGDNSRTPSKRGVPDPSRAAEPHKKRKGAETVADSAKSPEGPKRKNPKSLRSFQLKSGRTG